MLARRTCSHDARDCALTRDIDARLGLFVHCTDPSSGGSAAATSAVDAKASGSAANNASPAPLLTKWQALAQSLSTATYQLDHVGPVNPVLEYLSCQAVRYTPRRHTKKSAAGEAAKPVPFERGAIVWVSRKHSSLGSGDEGEDSSTEQMLCVITHVLVAAKAIEAALREDNLWPPMSSSANRRSMAVHLLVVPTPITDASTAYMLPVAEAELTQSVASDAVFRQAQQAAERYLASRLKDRMGTDDADDATTHEGRRKSTRRSSTAAAASSTPAPTGHHAKRPRSARSGSRAHESAKTKSKTPKPRRKAREKKKAASSTRGRDRSRSASPSTARSSSGSSESSSNSRSPERRPAAKKKQKTAKHHAAKHRSSHSSSTHNKHRRDKARRSRSRSHSAQRESRRHRSRSRSRSRSRDRRRSRSRSASPTRPSRAPSESPHGHGCRCPRCAPAANASAAASPTSVVAAVPAPAPPTNTVTIPLATFQGLQAAVAMNQAAAQHQHAPIGFAAAPLGGHQAVCVNCLLAKLGGCAC
jgi:hypothetical protein